MPPASKSAGDAKKKSSAKTKDKEKEKEKEKGKKSAKDKGDKPKKKSETSDKPKKKREREIETATEPLTSPAAVTLSAPPVIPPLDPDAVQLFRRYDRARTGVILRSDFLQLLRDYAHLPRTAHGLHGGALTRRPPLSLTDSRGIPLGYERSHKNSEFEAGQLFERYDRDHTGALTLDKFGEFFRDFQPQLHAFVDDLSYSTSAAVYPLNEVAAESETAKQLGDPTVIATPPSTAGAQPLFDSQQKEGPPVVPLIPPLRTAYQSTLWELRKICKEELSQQRERIRDEMTSLRDVLASDTSRPEERGRDGLQHPRSLSEHSFDHYIFSSGRRAANHWSAWGTDNQRLDRYDAIEHDLERVDEILRVTRRQLRKGGDVTVEDMKLFMSVAPQLLADAREFVMKPYRSPLTQLPSNGERRGDRTTSPLKKESPKAASTNKISSPVAAPNDSLGSKGDHATVEQLQKTLQIKDQLIYQLLQERTTLRRQKASVEAELHELTDVSTTEMRKWAALTDDMQDEIALLRDQLNGNGGGESSRRLNSDYTKVFSYGYPHAHA